MSSSTDVDPSPGAAAGRFPGWWVVAGSFWILAVSAGFAFYGLAVYLNAFSNEQGWSLSSISLATTLFFVISGTVGLAVASLIARFDVRLVIIAGAVLGGAALATLGRVEERWQLYLAYAVFGVGFAASGLVPVTTVVTRWFHARRAVALSVASTGLSVGGILITPIAKRLIDEYGLGDVTPWLGLAFFVGIAPVAWFLIRPEPAQHGWSPDGVVLDPIAAVDPPAGVPFAEAVRSRFYRAVTYGYVLVLGAQVGGIQQLVKLVEGRTDARTAEFAITALAATSVVARLVGGRVVQHVPMARFTIIVSLIQTVALCSLAFATSTPVIFASIILFGTSIGNILMLQPLLVAERFGVADYPRIFGRSQFVTVVGVAGGPLVLGALYDVAGSYRLAYVVAACLCAIGAWIISLGGPADGVTRSERAPETACSSPAPRT
jgi:MFS family permease